MVAEAMVVEATLEMTWKCNRLVEQSTPEAVAAVVVLVEVAALLFFAIPLALESLTALLPD
jgi:hypothetical protein